MQKYQMMTVFVGDFSLAGAPITRPSHNRRQELLTLR